MKAAFLLIEILILTTTQVCLEAQAVHLTMPIPDASGWIRIESAGFTNRVHILESSTNLQKWTEAAILHDGPFRFAEAGPAGAATRFFRALTRPKTSQDDGKNQICFPEASQHPRKAWPGNRVCTG